MENRSGKNSGCQRMNIAALDNRYTQLEDGCVKGVRRGLEELSQEKREDVCRDDIERRHIFDKHLKFREDDLWIVAQIDGPENGKLTVYGTVNKRFLLPLQLTSFIRYPLKIRTFKHLTSN